MLQFNNSSSGGDIVTCKERESVVFPSRIFCKLGGFTVGQDSDGQFLSLGRPFNISCELEDVSGSDRSFVLGLGGRTERGSQQNENAGDAHAANTTHRSPRVKRYESLKRKARPSPGMSAPG